MAYGDDHAPVLLSLATPQNRSALLGFRGLQRNSTVTTDDAGLLSTVSCALKRSGAEAAECETGALHTRSPQ
jgi:hypothetical protein